MGAGVAPPSLVFEDSPATREVSDSHGDPLPAEWSGTRIGDTDSDGDGMTDWQEYIAGTSATDPYDCLAILECTVSEAGKGAVIGWNSVAGRWYTVYMSTSLLGNWTPVHTVKGDGTYQTFTSDGNTPPPVFLRVGVRIHENR